MEDEKSFLETLIIEKGHSAEKASDMVRIVLEARKEARELFMKKYIGKRVTTKIGTLNIEVVVHDVKINYDGKCELQVKPINGSGAMWVTNFTH